MIDDRPPPRPTPHQPVSPAPSKARKRPGDWARRVPLLPALIFVIVMTQLPFVATIVISFMNWNAYYPEERGFAGLANFVRVFTDANTRRRSSSRSC